MTRGFVVGFFVCVCAVLILVSHFQGIAGADGLPGDKGELVGDLNSVELTP